ncbi:MAG: sigma-70 family RNA polymerase sigma factor [Sumerlaeia bacterium]
MTTSPPPQPVIAWNSTIEVADEDLVERVLAGERAVFETLVTRHERGVYALMMRMTRSREDAEDLTQEAFLKAFENLGSFRRGARFRPWLYRIASNAAVSTLRKRKPQADFDPDWNADPAPGADDLIAEDELRAVLAEAIEALPAAARALVHLRYREEMEIAEIAEIVGKTPSAAKVALHRARETLKALAGQRLDPRGGTR